MERTRVERRRKEGDFGMVSTGADHCIAPRLMQLGSAAILPARKHHETTSSVCSSRGQALNGGCDAASF